MKMKNIREFCMSIGKLFGLKKKETRKEIFDFGEGVYWPNDVSDILKLPKAKVRYLLRGYRSFGAFNKTRITTIDFLGLIEFYFYYFLRVEQKWTPRAVRELHAQLSREFDTPYPFASLKNEKLQTAYKEFIGPFFSRIEFGDDFMPKRFYPLANSKIIVVDPNVQFGHPFVRGRGVKTKVLYSFYLGGESIRGISMQYELEIEQVESAIRFHEQKVA